MAIAIGLSTLYCLVFLVRPMTWWPTSLQQVVGYPSRSVRALIDGVLHLVGTVPYDAHLRLGIYLLLVSGVIPWVVLALIRRGRPHDLGFRLPNRYGWSLTFVGYVVAVPFLVWMVQGAGFAKPYLTELGRAGAAMFIVYYFVNMLTEHFFLHGALLAVCRPGRRWPSPAPVSTDAVNAVVKALQWLGFAQPTGEARGMRRLIRWIGLPDGCVPAIVASAMLFGLVHVGKDPRELFLSLPGGFALAYISYRTNSWFTPFVLHLATAGTACLMIVTT